EEETPDKFLPAENSAEEIINPTDKELFLTAMGNLPVRFKDHLPENNLQPLAVPRRMKQLKQAKLTPDASLDLHGCQRTEVEEKLRYFLQNAQHKDWQTLLVITGKGLHSDAGKPILRDAAELFLSGEGRKIVAEWGRATKQYGGDGALIVFLRKKINNL
ncbi:MAG: Smr/MutS family protein, partial [Desulfuromusa sp.]|nr:Smr/MutS family protein [Desulfuromusa sp.]